MTLNEEVLVKVFGFVHKEAEEAMYDYANNWTRNKFGQPRLRDRYESPDGKTHYQTDKGYGESGFISPKIPDFTGGQNYSQIWRHLISQGWSFNMYDSGGVFIVEFEKDGRACVGMSESEGMAVVIAALKC